MVEIIADIPGETLQQRMVRVDRERNEKALALARPHLPALTEALRQTSVAGHKVADGRVHVEVRVREERIWTSPGALQSFNFLKDLFWYGARNCRGEMVSPEFARLDFNQVMDAFTGVQLAKDPAFLKELKRVRAEVRALVKRLEAAASESKKEVMRDGLRSLISQGKSKWGLDKDDLIDVFEQELKLLRVELVQAG